MRNAQLELFVSLPSWNWLSMADKVGTGIPIQAKAQHAAMSDFKNIVILVNESAERE